MIRALVVCAVLMPVPQLAAADLALPPAARELSEWISPLDSYDLPLAPYDGTGIPAWRFEGRLERRTWRIAGGAGTALQILAPLREQASADGFETVFECKDRECGGFDFRFATEVAPPPDMHVNLRDYRFLSAVRNETEALSLLVSVSRTAAYVQEIRVRPPPDDPGPSTRP